MIQENKNNYIKAKIHLEQLTNSILYILMTDLTYFGTLESHITGK